MLSNDESIIRIIVHSRILDIYLPVVNELIPIWPIYVKSFKFIPGVTYECNFVVTFRLQEFDGLTLHRLTWGFLSSEVPVMWTCGFLRGGQYIFTYSWYDQVKLDLSETLNVCDPVEYWFDYVVIHTSIDVGYVYFTFEHFCIS